MKTKSVSRFLILFLLMTIGITLSNSAFAQKYSKFIRWQDRTVGHITHYPKGHQATAPYLPELIVHYNKQHLPYTDERNMYPRGQQSDVPFTPELIINYDKQHHPISSE